MFWNSFGRNVGRKRGEGGVVGDKSVYAEAKRFVDEQIDIDRKHGRALKLSKEEYERLVRRVARATPHIESAETKSNGQ